MDFISGVDSRLGEDSVIVSKDKWNQIQNIVAQSERWKHTNQHSICVYFKKPELWFMERNYPYLIEDIHISNDTPEHISEQFNSIVGKIQEETSTEAHRVEKIIDNAKVYYEERINSIPRWLRWLYNID